MGKRRFFLDSIKGFVSKAKTIKEGKNPKLHLPGFVLPLQIWGYECIPRFMELDFAMILVAYATPLMRGVGLLNQGRSWSPNYKRFDSMRYEYD